MIHVRSTRLVHALGDLLSGQVPLLFLQLICMVSRYIIMVAIDINRLRASQTHTNTNVGPLFLLRNDINVGQNSRAGFRTSHF